MIWEMQRQVAYLKFVKNFLEQRNDIRKFLRLHSYNEMMKCYKLLTRIPDDSDEVIN